jgi:hypothetical protein
MPVAVANTAQVNSVATASAPGAHKAQMQRLEELFDQVRAFDQVAHEHKQRDRDEHIVAHHLVGRLHHQRERFSAITLVGDPREQHAHAHEGEGGGKAEHDRDHHQGEHHEPQVAVGDFFG